jgi:hypothetical protein
MHPPDHFAPPGDILSEAQQTVEQIVAGGDIVKHFPDKGEFIIPH